MKNRRRFITLLGGAAAAAWPLVAGAQQPAIKVPKIGWLQPTRNENVEMFLQGLRDAGYVEGRSAVIEMRIPRSIGLLM